MQRIEEAGARRFEDGEKLLFALGEGLDNGALLGKQGQFVGKEESDAAIAFADRLDAGPGHFACGNERVEARRIVPSDAGGEDGRSRAAKRVTARPAGFRWRQAVHRDAHAKCVAA